MEVTFNYAGENHGRILRKNLYFLQNLRKICIFLKMSIFLSKKNGKIYFLNTHFEKNTD